MHGSLRPLRAIASVGGACRADLEEAAPDRHAGRAGTVVSGADGDARAREVAAGHLARRDLSRRRLAQRLERGGIDSGAVERVVDAFAEAGYLDDARLARSRAEQLARRGYGDELIAQRLEAQGVDPVAIGEALAALEPEIERARSQCAAASDPLRAAAKLARRGFSPEAVEAACDVPSDTVMDGPGGTELR